MTEDADDRRLPSFRDFNAVQVHVSLDDIEPRIWRRLIVPLDTTLADMHPIIQVAMGWMAAISHVFTLPRAAARLGISEELLAEIAIDLEPEDGVLWVHDSTEESCYGFTLFGLESVQENVSDKPTLAFI